ncbi:branched-subunit amino acid aminotransferase/4-amino-4-deoxychorismate lyase [Actinokineospora baliensis]|uniref:aminotransferase class IV n=1 Tax=Actinokineospora baliensis TaxID=547056 RepID=UPI00195D78F1|nr:aminotransferase class IV [Actinokineospora baliensis]MBM7773147.1 branched-subunit amino acid aminotransferase/4-amino-4-deoxychorismate lyase [Actinokineospora baliensis]
MSTVEYVFADGALQRSGLQTGDLLAADSWLVLDGAVRGLHWHHRRFQQASTETGHGDTTAFWAAVVAAFPKQGAWFPRVELTPAGTFQLRVRPSPPIGKAIRIHRADQPDKRVHPRRKGPDLPLLNNIREQARAAGADETLLVDDHGYVLESATASLIWWENDILCVPDEDLPVLDGVTTRVIIEHAYALGITVGRRRRQPHQLVDKEAWLVNALHGLRPIVAWPTVPAVPATRAPYWQGVLESLRVPLPV